MRSRQTTIAIQYQHKQFIYSRTAIRPVNQMIAIRQALQKCFQLETTSIGCFSWFKSSRKHANAIKYLAPNKDSFYVKADDQAIIQKSLILIARHGLCHPTIVHLCLELTKHHDYQAGEHRYQEQVGREDIGLLTNVYNAQSIACIFIDIFQSVGYDLALPIKQLPKQVSSYQDIYIRSCR